MRQRSYVQRNRRVELQELTDVIAVHATDSAGRARSNQIPVEVLRAVPAAQLDAFERAGWVFQSPSARELPATAPRAKVFLKSGNRLALGTGRLTVQFKGDLSAEQVDELLRPFGGRVVNQLTFAPGLFEVAVVDETRGDAVDLANALVASGRVEFAEPDLVEVMGQRSP